MCLAVPARVVSLHEAGFAEVELGGVRHRVCIDLVPGVRVGDFVIVHAGFALTVVDQDQARETLDLLEQLASLVRDQASPAAPAPHDAH